MPKTDTFDSFSAAEEALMAAIVMRDLADNLVIETIKRFPCCNFDESIGCCQNCQEGTCVCVRS